MSYSVKVKDRAAKALRKIPRQDRIRLIEAIDRLASDPYAGSALKGELAGLRRVRVGQYRIVYDVIAEELIILVVRIAHRSAVYR